MNSWKIFLFSVVALLVNLVYSEDTGFNPSTLEIVEGGSGAKSTIIVGSFMVSAIICTISESTNTINLSPNILGFTPSSDRKTKNFSATKGTVPDGSDSITLIITLTCPPNHLLSPIKQPTLTLVIKKEGSNIEKDPHLMQYINGVDESSKNVQKRVCYDLYGKSGDQFEVISDQLIDSAVIMELRDDFYIGKVLVQTPFGYINITTDNVFVPNRGKYEWSTSEDLSLKRPKNNLQIDVEIRNEYVSIGIQKGTRKLNARIEKTSQNFGKRYLNVMIDKLMSESNRIDKYHGGLFGEISNKRYQFYNPVQKDQTASVVQVDNRTVRSTLKETTVNEKELCYFMKMNDLLYPNSVDVFKRFLN